MPAPRSSSTSAQALPLSTIAIGARKDCIASKLKEQLVGTPLEERELHLISPVSQRLLLQAPTAIGNPRTQV